MKLAKPELDVALVSSDAVASCAFYREVLGFEQLPSVPLGKGTLQHRFGIGRHLVKINQLAQPPARQRGGVEHAIGMRLLAFILDDLPAVVLRLDQGGRRHTPLDPGPDSPYTVEFTKDPEGNVLELIGLRKPASAPLTSRLQVGLTVANVDRSRRFYGEQLGLPEEPIMKVGGAVGVRYGFTWGSTTIKFWSLREPPPVQTGAPMLRSGIRTFTAMVEDVDEAHAELLAKDVPVAMAPVDLPGIARVMFISDPDGNWIELAQTL